MCASPRIDGQHHMCVCVLSFMSFSNSSLGYFQKRNLTTISLIYCHVLIMFINICVFFFAVAQKYGAVNRQIVWFFSSFFFCVRNVWFLLSFRLSFHTLLYILYYIVFEFRLIPQKKRICDMSHPEAGLLCVCNVNKPQRFYVQKKNDNIFYEEIKIYI